MEEDYQITQSFYLNNDPDKSHIHILYSDNANIKLLEKMDKLLKKNYKKEQSIKIHKSRISTDILNFKIAIVSVDLEKEEAFLFKSEKFKYVKKLFVKGEFIKPSVLYQDEDMLFDFSVAFINAYKYRDWISPSYKDEGRVFTIKGGSEEIKPFDKYKRVKYDMVNLFGENFKYEAEELCIHEVDKGSKYISDFLQNNF